MSDFIEYDSRAALFDRLAKTVAAELARAILARGKAVLAVPGGTTPAPFFKILRKAPLDWAKISVLLTDERFVPETSPRSNTRLLRENLLHDTAEAADLVPLYAPADSAEQVLDQLSAGVQAVLPIDVCVLGMGADMHTASLFPGADLLEQALDPDAPPLLPMRAAGAAEPRITLTAPVLESAGSAHILITGTEKKAALALAQEVGPVAQAPVRIVLNRKGPTSVHYAD